MARKTLLGGINVNIMSSSEVFDLVSNSIDSGEQLRIAFANTNLINWANWRTDVAFALRNFKVINDGIGLQIAYLLTHFKRFPENLNGTDLVPRLLGSFERRVSVYLLGADAETVARTALVLGRIPHLHVCGCWDGYSCWDSMPEVLDSINAAAPDILLVAMGNPRQELWIAKHATALRVPVLIGVGALFDYLAGTKKRAPICWRRLRTEWLYRLVYEPRRLWRRYSVELALFFFFIVRGAFAGGVQPPSLRWRRGSTFSRAAIAFAEKTERFRHRPL
jgi:exopolysaccharide biosynthesis WecB/TagA/CpsF family protein